jgi:eukaryotic-like serine/threonine-protein kinase
MKPEHWQEVERLFNAALEVEPARRRAFLSQTCAGNESVRREVERLLEGQSEAEGFMESSAMGVAARLAADSTPSGSSPVMIGKAVSHYRIVDRLGSGGMGIVYKAEDTRLRRQVALKFLSGGLASDHRALERFQLEARAASALNHPHICTIYDIDESEGRTFIVMELLEGKTLNRRLETGPPGQSPLPTSELADIAIQVAGALEAAHGKGIIHRDIKPANIMLTQSGQTKILDFGLAKLPASRRPDAENTATESLTSPGMAIGTVAYMSPEQARGEELDERSDLFSFGVVLYEMATGQQAFTGNTSFAVIDAILNRAPTSPVKLNPKIPVELGSIINRALVKDRKERYQRASDMAADLQRLKRGGDSGRKTALTTLEPANTMSFAVLPFANMSADKENEYFGDGLAEEIINALTRLPGLRVIARTSSFSFRGKEVDIREIGAELNVKHILEGSVRKAGNRIRITTQLVNTADGYHLWSERYDREITDVFAIQDEICQAIVDKLRLELTADRSHLKHHTENLEAYNLYLKGRYHLNKWTGDGLAKSKEYYEQAIALDPAYALAWNGLALYHFVIGFLGYVQPSAAYAHCRKATLKALELDETLAEGHSMMGVLRASEYDWKDAEREFRRALDLDPNSEQVWTNYIGYYLVPMGRLDEAIAAWKRAVELDPLSPDKHFRLGYCYRLMRQLDRAVEHFRNALELDPNYHLARLGLAISYQQTGRIEESIRAYETFDQVTSHSPYAIATLGSAYAQVVRIGEARKLLAELYELALKAYVSPTFFFAIHFSLGEIDTAFDWLEKAVNERDSVMANMHVDPLFEPLRSHPRFQALMRNMNLEF